MSRPRIVVVNSSSFGRRIPAHLERLRRLGSVERLTVPPSLTGSALAWRLGPCTAVVASVAPRYDAAFFAAQPGLKILARHGIGTDNVDLVAARRRGVKITKVPGIVEREAMAEHTLALILAVGRRLHPAHVDVAAGRWNLRAAHVGFELHGRTVGLVGFGNIGSRVGEILARGFGAVVLACDPAVSAARMRRGGARKASLDTLLARSSVVSLHCSLNRTSRRLLTGAALRRMPPGAILINTARGELVDEHAVAAALRSGRLAGLGTDVVAEEPAAPSHPYLRHPNVLVVPHIGAYTEESLAGMGESVVRAVEAALRR